MILRLVPLLERSGLVREIGRVNSEILLATLLYQRAEFLWHDECDGTVQIQASVTTWAIWGKFDWFWLGSRV